MRFTHPRACRPGRWATPAYYLRCGRCPHLCVSVPRVPLKRRSAGIGDVFVNGFLVGHLSREIAGAVQPSLIAFTAASSGRTVACPAQILWHEIDDQPVAQVVLRLDPAPLGLAADAFTPIPEIDRVIQQHMRRLDTAAPAMTGCDAAARSLLAAAAAQRSEADADYEHGATRWPQVERAFLQASVSWSLLAIRWSPTHGLDWAEVPSGLAYGDTHPVAPWTCPGSSMKKQARIPRSRCTSRRTGAARRSAAVQAARERRHPRADILAGVHGVPVAQAGRDHQAFHVGLGMRGLLLVL